MRINPNLYQGKTTLEYDGKGKQWYNGVFIPVPALEEGELYTLSCDINRINYEDIPLYKSVNVGPTRADGSTIYEKEYGYTATDVSSNVIIYTFKYRSDIKSIWAYSNIGNRPRVKAIYSKIKIEKGKEKTPYIPSINTIETAKRQYFIGGGTFKEVYPI